MGFNINSDFLSYSVSPYAGYKFTDRLSAGMRFTYQHARYNQIDVRVNSYGFGPFARFQLTEQFFAYTEYEYLTFRAEDRTANVEFARENFDSWFLGGGLSQPFGRNAAFNIMFLYNLLYDDGTNTPYNSPIVLRAGVDVGF